MMYHPYKGRSGGHKRLIIIIISLIAALAAASYLVAENCIVFTDDGVSFNMPFLKHLNDKSDKLTPIDDGSFKMEVVNPPQKDNKDNDVKKNNNEAVPANETQVLRAVYIPPSKLNDKAYLESVKALVKESGINAVMVDIKNYDGTLNYNSGIEAAVHSQASANAYDNYEECIKSLSKDGLYVIGRVCTFHDNTVTSKSKELAVKTKNSNWIDRKSSKWLNPYLAESQNYITQIINESSGFGFSEIMLDDFCFPTNGKTSLINYGKYTRDSKTEVISGFLKSLKNELEKSGIKLSVYVTDKAAEEGSNKEAGQDFKELSLSADRIYFNLPIKTQYMENTVKTVDGRLTEGFKSGKVIPILNISANVQKTLKDLLNIKPETGYIFKNETGIYSSADFK